MNRALAATLVMLFNSAVVNAASAQSYVESNATDAICEWQIKGQKGIEKCRIIAMGTHAMNDLVFMFTLKDKVIYLVQNEPKKYYHAEIGTGGFWDFKSEWKGTYKDKFEMLGDPETTSSSMDTIKLSNGYKIKIVY